MATTAPDRTSGSPSSGPGKPNYTGRKGENAGTRAYIPWKTLRTDKWWVQPLVTFAVLLFFVVYTTIRAFMNRYYHATPYLSPFYSPCLAANCKSGSADLGTWFGDWWKLSPAILILVFPGGFRFTCYYYRKAYYRSFWLSPPACAVAEPHKRYTGESRFPMLVQNLHRFLFYIAILFNLLLTWDAIHAFRDHQGHWGHMQVGTLVLVANAVFLWLYSLSCHSCRHAVGGRINHFSKHPMRYRFWTFVTRLNARHMTFAWISLVFVMVADLYVALYSAGHLTDYTIF